MSLESRKIRVIEYLLSVEDETELQKIEESLVSYRTSNKLEPLTKEDIIERALKSNRDIKDGNCISQEQLREESKSW